MSYITFDFKCDSCGKVDERIVRRSELDNQFCMECSDAGVPYPYLVKVRPLPAGTRTTFKFADKTGMKP